MCDPITIASAALMAGSLGANMYGQSQVQGARDDASAAERIRQKKFDEEAAALQLQSEDRYKNFEGQQGERATDLSNMYKQTQESVVGAPAAPAEAATGSNAGSVVAREAAKQKEKTAAFTNQQADAQGGMAAFGDLLGDVSRKQARDAGQIAQIGGFKKGSSQALSYELNAANEEGQGARLLGDILGGLGSMGMMTGLRGGSLGSISLGRGAAPAMGAPMQLAGASTQFNPLAIY